MTIHQFDRSPINRISAEALTSNAVNHPYLRAIRDGSLPNIELAIKDFAFQYSIYSSQFSRYLSIVINNLRKTQHQEILLQNLSEEHGDIHHVDLPPEIVKTITGVPHAQLYHRFQEAVGVDDYYRAKTHQCQAAFLWRNQFLELCEMDECVGIGAIGIGTEFIVSKIYDQILEGIKVHSNLTMTERVFFDLHSQCDDEHATQFLSIAKDLARDNTACKKIEYGAKMALDIRAVFWDEMLERAQNFPAFLPSTDKS